MADGPVKFWSMKSALEQIAKCDFQCEAGPLAMNDAWVWLLAAAKVGPEFWPGQGVWFLVEGTVGTIKLSAWHHFYVVAASMRSNTSDRYWVYSLSNDPPAPYRNGVVSYTDVMGDRLRLEKPSGEPA